MAQRVGGVPLVQSGATPVMGSAAFLRALVQLVDERVPLAQLGAAGLDDLDREAAVGEGLADRGRVCLAVGGLVLLPQFACRLLGGLGGVRGSSAAAERLASSLTSRSYRSVRPKRLRSTLLAGSALGPRHRE